MSSSTAASNNGARATCASNGKDHINTLRTIECIDVPMVATTALSGPTVASAEARTLFGEGSVTGRQPQIQGISSICGPTAQVYRRRTLFFVFGLSFVESGLRDSWRDESRHVCYTLPSGGVYESRKTCGYSYVDGVVATALMSTKAWPIFLQRSRRVSMSKSEPPEA